MIIIPGQEKELNADRVAHNLWVGAVPTNPELVDKNFDALVLCAREFQDVFPVHKYPKVEVILAPLDDAKPTREEKITALKAAIRVHELRTGGKKVLSTCAQGVNRSALVAALALIIGGLTADEAIKTIRKKRVAVSGATPLFNPYFQKFLKFVDEAFSTTDSHTR